MMTREKKFRAWHEGNKGFIYATLQEIWKNGYQVREAHSEEYAQGRVLMERPGSVYCTEEYLNERAIASFEGGKADWKEYTGLHDKNGTEIYEGDILFHDHFGNGYETSKHRVQFGEGTFDGGYYRFIGWHCGEDHSAQDVLLPKYGTIEVIGNISENPELVE